VNDLVVLLAMLAAGLGAGALVTLVARALPERGRPIGRPVCAAKGCDLPWAAASQTLRAVGFARACQTCGAGPVRSDVLLEIATALLFGALSLVWPPSSTLLVHAGFVTLLMMILAIDLRHREVYLILGFGGIVLALLAAPLSMSGGIFSAAVGSIVGGLAAVGILASGAGRKVFMPYGPALCIGGFWVMLVR